MALKNKLTALQKALLILVAAALAYLLYSLWFHGAFAVTQTQKKHAFARRIRYYQDRISTMPLDPYPNWHHDATIIPRAQQYGDEIVPYLARELWRSTSPYGSGSYQIEAACFLLANVIRTKLALSTLVDAGREEYPVMEALITLIGPAGMEYRVAVGAHLVAPPQGTIRATELLRAYALAWHDKNVDNVLNTDYGIGLVQPDKTVRPLGFHGVVTYASDLPDEYYFCTEIQFSYMKNLTVAHRELGKILYERNPQQWWGANINDNLAKASRETFRDLFAERLRTDSSFWPFYPVMRRVKTEWGQRYLVVGYYDSEHRRHGLWRDIKKNTVIAEKWFFHGEELPEDEYYARGGYDMAISLPWTYDDSNE